MNEPPFESSQSSSLLFAAVYERLKAMAGKRLAAGGRSVTLDTTSLVHELYLRVNGHGDLAFAHPSQFFAYAARAMRHLLTDRARSRLSQKAGADWIRVTLTESDDSLALESADQVIALDGALTKLAGVDERAATVIELRYFAGLTSEQVAEVLAISKRTADRDWAFAAAFLKAELG
jgi:RNA polymerase sigma factor (TIGR02999 family)